MAKRCEDGPSSLSHRIHFELKNVKFKPFGNSK